MTTTQTGPVQHRGFTLIELLVVLAIVALLLTIVTPRTIDHLARARETTLQATLKEMRHAIDQFQADRGRAPDPITERDDTWVTVSVAEGDLQETASTELAANGDAEGIADVHSGAEGEGRNGTPYATW
jgi:general secretion pathway protein G